MDEGLRRRILGIGLALSGCQRPTAVPQDVPFVLEARSDVDEPVEGVEFFVSGKALGKTDGNGRLEASVSVGLIDAGDESEEKTLELVTQCPVRYEPPLPRSIELTPPGRDSAGVLPQLVRVTCTMVSNEIAVVVRAPQAKNAPVLVDGEVVTHTDANGNAHHAVTVPRGRLFMSVQVDTADRLELTPPSPERVFSLTDGDHELIFEPEFKKRKTFQRKLVQSASPAPQRVPRLDGHNAHGRTVRTEL